MLVHIQKKIKMIKFKFQKTNLKPRFIFMPSILWNKIQLFNIYKGWTKYIRHKSFHFYFLIITLCLKSARSCSPVLYSEYYTSSWVSHLTALHAKMEMGRLTAWYGWLNICVHVSNHYCKFRSHIYMREYVVFIFCAWIISLDTTISTFVWFSANVRISFFFS